jgi:hypothetical protein
MYDLNIASPPTDNREPRNAPPLTATGVSGSAAIISPRVEKARSKTSGSKTETTPRATTPLSIETEDPRAKNPLSDKELPTCTESVKEKVDLTTPSFIKVDPSIVADPLNNVPLSTKALSIIEHIFRAVTASSTSNLATHLVSSPKLVFP